MAIQEGIAVAKRMRYFAYGSNLFTRRLQTRAPSARFMGRARLVGYRIRFRKRGKDGSGKASIHATSNLTDAVWGAVFECSAGDKRALDRVEGLGNGYNEHAIVVQMDDGTEASVLAYVADPAAVDEALLPFTWYRDCVVLGAEEQGLPEEYIRMLQRESVVADPEPGREIANTCTENDFR